MAVLNIVRFIFLATLCLASNLLVAGQRADLVFLNGAEPETLDPHLIVGQPDMRLADALFEGLTTFDAAANAGPGVAEKWEISPDGCTYLFHLRSDAQWSNGTPVTAEDFVQSWRRVLTPETASEYSYQLHYLKNGRAYNEGKIKDFSQVGVHALDARTLKVELESPTPFFLELCAIPPLFPVPVATIERYGDSWVKPGKLIGNGPYALKEWRVNDHILLEKNPRYWDRAHVAMQTVEVIPTPKANTALNYYLSGLADLSMDKGLIPPALLNELRTRPDFHSAPFLGSYFIRFNASRPPFKDPRVRQAFSMVIDKKLLVEKITRAGEVPAYSLVPPGAAGYQPPEGLPEDIGRARKLLAEAGYPGGKGFPLVSYLYSEGELNEAIAVELQGMFRSALGVEIGLQRQEWKVYLRSLTTLDYDLARSTWVGDYRDPNTFLDMFVTGGGNNRTGWGNPQYDQLIAEAGRELDPKKRLDLFRSAEHLLVAEQAVIAPLYYYVGIQLYDQNRLGGVEANLLDEHPLKTMYWKKP